MSGSERVIQDRLRRIKNLCDLISRLLEEGDRASAAALAVRLDDEVRQSASDLGVPRRESVVSRSAAPRELAEPDAKAGSPAPVERQMPTPSDEDEDILERMIRVSWERISLLWRDPARVKQFVDRYKMPFTIIGGTVVVLVGGWLFVTYGILARHGVKAEFYNGMSFEHLVCTRRYDNINFDWSRQSPTWGVHPDHFSARFTGFLKTPVEGDYDFYTISDDGVRLWIGDKLVIDNWTVHPAGEDHGQIHLTRGYHPIRVEYFENEVAAAIRVFWKNDSMIPKQIISKDYLVPSERYTTDLD